MTLLLSSVAGINVKVIVLYEGGFYILTGGAVNLGNQFLVNTGTTYGIEPVDGTPVQVSIVPNVVEVPDPPAPSLALDDLTDVAAPAPNTDDVLSWDGSQWAPAQPTSGPGGSSSPTGLVWEYSGFDGNFNDPAPGKFEFVSPDQFGSGVQGSIIFTVNLTDLNGNSIENDFDNYSTNDPVTVTVEWDGGYMVLEGLYDVLSTFQGTVAIRQATLTGNEPTAGDVCKISFSKQESTLFDGIISIDGGDLKILNPLGGIVIGSQTGEVEISGGKFGQWTPTDKYVLDRAVELDTSNNVVLGNGGYQVRLNGINSPVEFVPGSTIDFSGATINNFVDPENVAVGFIGVWTVYTPTASDLPENWLRCNGASLGRDLYPELFAVIGTRYGSVNSLTFNLPNITPPSIPTGGSTIGYIIKYA